MDKVCRFQCDACSRYVPAKRFLRTIMTNGGEGSFCPICRNDTDEQEEMAEELAETPGNSEGFADDDQFYIGEDEDIIE
jgi:hypothetical protein